MTIQKIISQGCSLFSTSSELNDRDRLIRIASHAFDAFVVCIALTLSAAFITMSPIVLGVVIAGAVLCICICAYKAWQGAKLQTKINSNETDNIIKN